MEVTRRGAVGSVEDGADALSHLDLIALGDCQRVIQVPIHREQVGLVLDDDHSAGIVGVGEDDGAG